MTKKIGWLDLVNGPIATIIALPERQPAWLHTGEGCYHLTVAEYQRGTPCHPGWPARPGSLCDRLGLLGMTLKVLRGERVVGEREAGERLSLTPQAITAIIAACRVEPARQCSLELQRAILRSLAMSACLPRSHCAAPSSTNAQPSLPFREGDDERMRPA